MKTGSRATKRQWKGDVSNKKNHNGDNSAGVEIGLNGGASKGNEVPGDKSRILLHHSCIALSAVHIELVTKITFTERQRYQHTLRQCPPQHPSLTVHHERWLLSCIIALVWWWPSCCLQGCDWWPAKTLMCRIPTVALRKFCFRWSRQSTAPHW